MMEHADGMVDKAVALLSNLSTISEGRLETAASILLQLCLHSSKFCTLVYADMMYTFIHAGTTAPQPFSES
ncbi:hypothetical protein Lalb_Chr02g0152491 [Lupinus albus]|uniref:Uncharacterized protein n=1 Tax=Lupinus albus TaxID=3870 RepID=A0A6A4QY78_LUPAL|nr:hypothetical protein Lalb_Chr02g0152491 [Lupinus albus]